MAEFIDDDLPKIDVEITEGDDVPTPTPRDRDRGNDDKGDDKGDKDKGDKDKGDKYKGDKDKGDKDDKDDKDDKGDKDDKDKKNKDKDKDKEKEKDKEDKNKDKQHPLVGTLFYFENDLEPKWANKDYQIHEIIQKPDGSLAYTYFDRKNLKVFLVAITEERYYDMLNAEEIQQFLFKIGSKWITDKKDFIFTIQSLTNEIYTKIHYVTYNVNSGERYVESEFTQKSFYKDSEGNELSFPEWFDLQIQTGKYKPFEEENDDDEEPNPQEEPFPLSYGSMYVLATYNGAYRTNPKTYAFAKVLSNDFSGDYFTVRSYSENQITESNVDKGDFLTAYANDEVKIYRFKEEDKISTCDDNGIPDFEKVYELTDIARGGTGETNFFITLTTPLTTYTNNLVITDNAYEIGGISFNYIDYIDAKILSGKLVVISEDERKDDEEEEEQEEQSKRDIMKPPYLQSVNFYYELRNTDKSVMRVLLGKNYTAFAELLNESEKKDAEGDAKEGWYFAWTWQSLNIGQRQEVIETDEKLLKLMFLIVKNNLEKFANDYYFTNFLYDRIGYLFKDMIINGLSYTYLSNMVSEDGYQLSEFIIFPINEQEFLLYIYDERLDDKWVSHIRYKESEKEIVITNLLKGASELTDLLIIEKVENTEKLFKKEKIYFDDENNIGWFFDTPMIRLMKNYVSTISSGFF